ncbi:MAG: NUDIX hydrolase [Candidatus Roizmanbacteria bacterium]
MNTSPYLFQYCQKIVLLSTSRDAVLLARRKGENDYDEIYSFIGGKMEVTDGSILAGLRRERDEEVGSTCTMKILLTCTNNTFFVKKDGSHMILPHYPAIYQGGEIRLNNEYSEYQWVPLTKLKSFEPKIPNIYEMTVWADSMLRVADPHSLKRM